MASSSSPLKTLSVRQCSKLRDRCLRISTLKVIRVNVTTADVNGLTSSSKLRSLYNTAFGIAIAIPALIFYRHFKNKVDTYVVEMELQAAKLVDLIHGERLDFPGQGKR